MKPNRIICAVLLVLFLLIISVGCSIGEKKEAYNQVIQSWLEDNIQEEDDYKLKLGLLTVYDEWDKEKPENMPVSLTTEYEVHIFKSEKKAKIVATEWIKNQGLIEKTTYLSIKDDRVIIYRSTDSGFKKESYQDAQLVEAVSAIMFPNDVSIFDGVVVQCYITDESSLSMKTLGVQRRVDSEPFYRPYYLITGKQQEEKNFLSFNFSYDIKLKTMYTLTIHDVGNYYKTVYYLLNDSQYENIYTKNNIKYDQELSIYFYTMNKAEKFELPEVE